MNSIRYIQFSKIIFLIGVFISSGCSNPSGDTGSTEIEQVEPGITDTVLFDSGNTTYDEQDIRPAAEQMPVFPGGEEALMAYLKKNMRYPKSAIADGVTGLVYTSFVVDENGQISDIRILRTADERFNEPTMEVLRNMPAWEPGENKGEKVSVRYNLPVRYQLQNTDTIGNTAK